MASMAGTKQSPCSSRAMTDHNDIEKASDGIALKSPTVVKKLPLQLGDEFLASLAHAIETEEEVASLGLALGFTQADINRCIATNRLTGTVTSKGTREMLFSWRSRTPPADQPKGLRDALIRAGLSGMAEEYCGDRKYSRGLVSPNVHHVPVFSFENYFQTLQNHYQTVLCQIQRRPWDPNDFADLKHLFTEITMFQFDRSTGQLQKVPLDGSVNGIFGTKVKGQFPKRMLLTAPGGHGKTCAVAKLAYDWLHQTDGSPMKDVKALFVLKLREIDEAMGLGEAIMSQLIGDIPGVTPEAIENFIEDNQESCALIFDGYDEYKGSIKSTKVLNSLVQLLRNKKLKNCRVLVTTRPFLEGDFLQGELAKTYTKMSIEGFTFESAGEYIKRYFNTRSSPEDATVLLDYLKQDSFLGSLVKVPLFCTMICHLHEVDALSGARSMVSLFDNINRFLLQHALAKEVKLLPKDTELEDVLQNLGEFAFYGLHSDSKKLVFQEGDFQNNKKAYNIGIALGILSITKIPVKHLTNNQTSKTTVEFFHKLEQEYCASVFLRRLANCKCVGLPMLKRSSRLEMTLSKDLNTIAKTLEFENVLCLVAGVSRRALLSVIRHIAGQAREFVLYYKCCLVLHCLVEADPSFVDGDVAEALKECFWDGKLDLYPLTDRIMTGLERLPQSVKSKMSLVSLFSTNLSATMTDRLWACLALFKNLDKLYLNNASLTLTASVPLPSLPAVQRLEAWSLQEDTFMHLTQCLPKVKDFVFWIGNEDDPIQALRRITRSLKEVGQSLRWITINGLLNVNGSRVSRADCAAFGQEIQRSTTGLETLDLVEVKMEDDGGAIEIIKACRNVGSMKEISMKCSGAMSTHGLKSFLDNVGTRVETFRGWRYRRCTCLRISVELNDEPPLYWKVRRKGLGAAT